MKVAEILVVSTSDPSRTHVVTVERDPDRVSCTCTGCCVHGYCKHIRFYKSAIKRLLEEKEA